MSRNLILLAALVSASGCISIASDLEVADGGPRRDAGVAWDAGLSRPDGGLPVPDAGQPKPEPCTLGGPLVVLSGADQVHELADLVATPGGFAIAYARDRHAGGGWQLLRSEGTSEPAWSETPLIGFGSELLPGSLDHLDGRYLYAASPDGEPARLTAGYFDELGAARGDWQAADLEVLAAVRRPAGGFTLSRGLSAGLLPAASLVGQHWTVEGALDFSWELGTTRRTRLEADAAWREGAERAIVCGPSSEAEDEQLALYEVWREGLERLVSAEQLAAVEADVESAFGCRLADGEQVVAVALSETAGASRIVWLGEDGTTEAGPIPFFAGWKPAAQYDVAIDGMTTALAFYDRASGSPQISVRIYPQPGAKPVQLRGDEGLGLGDFSVGRVRLVRGESGFLLAFDARPRAGQSDVYVRPIQCGE